MKLKQYCWLAYYILLLLVMVSWQNPDQAPSTTSRLAFLAASVLPLFVFKKIKYLPIVFILFYSINIYGTALSYFPTYYYYYIPFILAGLLFVYNRKKNLGIASSSYLLCLLLVIFIVDIASASELCDISYCYLFLVLLIGYYSPYDINYVKLFQYLFVISSLVLSIEFLTVGREYTITLMGSEREAWMDPNYFGCVVGMGVIQAFLLLMRNGEKQWIVSILLTVTIVVSLITLVLNASRGALLATMLAFAYYLLTSKSKWYIKFIIVSAGIILGIYMLNNDYFTLLEERLSGGDTTGSGRTVIWQKKLTAFIDDSNILHWLLGLGNTGGAMLAFGFKRGFHNDFVGFLVSYGFVGFVLFVYSFVKPILKSTIYKKEVMVGILYLVTCCMTLEPFLSGYLPFFGFYFCCLLMSKIKLCSNV